MNNAVHYSVGGENSQWYGSQGQNRKAGVHAEQRSFSNVSITGTESTDLHQLVPPTAHRGLPEI